MWAFFYGWRRKAGCVTLLMALALMAGWIRSLSIGDGAVVQFPHLTHVLSSTGGHFSWMRHAGNFPTSDRITHLQWPVEQKVIHPFIFAEIDWQRRFRWNGFEMGEGHLIGIPLMTWTIPYWSLAIPLTLLSAYLILGKPRKRV
jgi:hypothetical protein